MVDIMTGIEIFLIIVGIMAIISSFIFAEKFDKTEKNNTVDSTGITEKMVEDQVSKAVDHILDDKIEETEAKMDKISNQKILAVGDYSETVLNDINKNHDEVMFLYGMLNDKEKEVKNAVIDIENVKKSIALIENEKNNEDNTLSDVIIKSESETSNEKNMENNKNAKSNKKNEEVKEFKISIKDPNSKNSGVALSHKEAKKNHNNNEKILNMYKEGKTNIEIAKGLGLGIGEVRLVIDLYKNKK